MSGVLKCCEAEILSQPHTSLTSTAMVRFKNRHLLVEFIDPSSVSTFPSAPVPPLPELEEFDGEEELAQIPDLPFVLPLDGSQQLLGEDGSSKIYKAVRGVVQDVFGDEGWGRVASSFKGACRVLSHSSGIPLPIDYPYDHAGRAPALPATLGVCYVVEKRRRACYSPGRGRQWYD